MTENQTFKNNPKYKAEKGAAGTRYKLRAPAEATLPENSLISTQPVVQIADEDVAGWMERLHSDPTLTVDELQELGASDQPRIRYAVATHALAPADLIDTLVHDTDDEIVVAGALRHPNLSPETQAWAFEKPFHSDVRGRLLQNTVLTEDLRARAAHGTAADLYAVVGRADVRAYEISLAAKTPAGADLSAHLQQAAASSPLLTEDDALLLADSKVYDVQEFVACNVGISEKVADKVISGGREAGRLAAQENLRVRANPPKSADEARMHETIARLSHGAVNSVHSKRAEAHLYEGRRRVYRNWAEKLS